MPTYTRFADQLGVPPGPLPMVGNSLRSDVLPVLAMGGRAVHIPYHVTWAHEVAVTPADADYVELRDIRELPGLLAHP